MESYGQCAAIFIKFKTHNSIYCTVKDPVNGYNENTLKVIVKSKTDTKEVFTYWGKVSRFACQKAQVRV